MKSLFSNKQLKLKNLILFCTLLFLIPIILVLKYVQYSDYKRETLENFEFMRSLIENNIITFIKMADNSYYIVEEILSPELEGYLYSLREEYEKIGDIDSLNLQNSKVQTGKSDLLDFYIINDESVIVKTTYPTDLGLDFKQFPDVDRYFKKIITQDKFFLDRLTVETRTGQYRLFGYLPTTDHKYILEVGYKIDRFRDILDRFSFIRIAESLKEINPLIEYVRVYDRHGHIFGNPDYTPTEELRDRFYRMFYERKGTDFNLFSEDRYYIFLDLSNPNYATDASKIVEIKYRVDIVKDKITKAFTDIILSGILILLICLFVAYVISYLIGYPLSKTIEDINAISKGELNRRLEVSKIAELNLLSESINRMVVSLRENIEEIKRQQLERERLELQLRQAQKMEAIGLLAGGIAHDFNNIMFAILGYTNLLQLKLGDNKELKGRLDQIVSAIERGTRLIRILLTFSRRQTTNLRMLDLNEIVSGINKLLRRIIGEDIRLNVSFAREPAWIMADITSIEQIIMNLVTNARDAMPQGGELTIAIEVKEIEEDLRKAHNVTDVSMFVVLRVVDTGHGIDKEIMDRIFDPFFTTKEVGKGTGLGLSVVYSIVTQHGGFIEVSSEKGKGTMFEIYFPYQRKAEQTDFQSQEEVLLEGGNETILFVEDDADIRNSTRFILERYGYKVIEASNGAEGLEIFSKRANEIDLIISDVVMPQMSGVKMYENILAIKDNVKIIFMSGYNEEILEQRASKNIDVIFKPIPPTELLKRIREKLKTV